MLLVLTRHPGSHSRLLYCCFVTYNFVALSDTQISLDWTFSYPLWRREETKTKDISYHAETMMRDRMAAAAEGWKFVLLHSDAFGISAH